MKKTARPAALLLAALLALPGMAPAEDLFPDDWADEIEAEWLEDELPAAPEETEEPEEEIFGEDFPGDEEAEDLPDLPGPEDTGAEAPGTVRYNPGTVRSSYQSDTLRFTVRLAKINGVKVFLSEVWMAEPGRQIVKETAAWREHLADTETMAKRLPDCRLAISGSGYVSPVYSWVPESYPGDNSDYFYTPLGSLTVTHGEVFRNLPGVPYYGLTLEADGLHLYNGADNAEVLAREPRETWSFYEQCPLILDGKDVLDRDWDFARRKAIRQIIARVDDHNYLILTSAGAISVTDCVDFLLQEVRPQMAYNLDGGPSAALLRRVSRSRYKIIQQNGQKNVDMMGFTD